MKGRRARTKSTNLRRTHKLVRKAELRQAQRKSAGRYPW